MHELIADIAVCILAAWLCGVAANLTRQPLILAYLVAGFVVGPSVTNWVSSQESISVIAELGLIFLLFMIGLEIDLKKIVSAGRAIFVTAATQIIGGAALGVALFVAIGMPMDGQRWEALYLGIAAALSSTVIIVKVLYDKRELDTLPGRITLGVLVLQDVFVILFLAVQPSLDEFRFSVVVLSLAKVALLIAAALLISKFVLPRLFHQIARLPELVLVGALAWCFAVSELAVHLNLSREMGALVAGVALSTFPYALDVTSKVTGLRDFFVTLFFVGLGLSLPLPDGDTVRLGLLIAAFAVASRVALTFAPLYLTGQGLRASLLPAINLAQLSEFSLVVMALGVSAKHIAVDTATAMSFAFVLLAVISTFVIGCSDRIVRFSVGALKRAGVRDLDDTGEEVDAAPRKSRIVVLGFYRVASSLLAELQRQNAAVIDDILVIDFNPHVHRTLNERGVKVRYGDVSHPELFAHTGVAEANIVLSSVPDSLLVGTTNEKIVRDVRALNPTAKIIATAEVLENVSRLYDAGADYVVVARLDEADDLIDALKAAEAGLLEDKRAALDARLTERNEVLP